MPRQKRSSRVLEKAEKRIAGMRSINVSLDLGTGLTLGNYSTSIQDLRNKLATYNEALSLVDRAANEMEVAEKTLGDLSERMLMGVGTKYGKDSHEYEMAGGVRKSERKRPTRKVPIAS